MHNRLPVIMGSLSFRLYRSTISRSDSGGSETSIMSSSSDQKLEVPPVVVVPFADPTEKPLTKEDNEKKIESGHLADDAGDESKMNESEKKLLNHSRHNRDRVYEVASTFFRSPDTRKTVTMYLPRILNTDFSVQMITDQGELSYRKTSISLGATTEDTKKAARAFCQSEHQAIMQYMNENQQYKSVLVTFCAVVQWRHASLAMEIRAIYFHAACIDRAAYVQRIETVEMQNQELKKDMAGLREMLNKLLAK